MTNDSTALDRYRSYVRDVLSSHEALVPILTSSTVIINDYDHVWDYLILFPEEVYKENILRQYGPNFVIDDHKHSPWVFTKVRSFEWLRRDITQRIAIALWIYTHAKVMQDPEQRFHAVILICQEEYALIIPMILRQKYLELRTERHNLRFHRQGAVAKLIKCSLVKLALELCFVFEGKPYPFKALLPPQQL